MTDRTQPEALAALIERFRGLHIDHEPDGWPAVRTREITALLGRIAELEAQLEAIGAGGVSALMGRAVDHFPDVTKMASRWYMVNKDGMATLCTDKADAEREAADAQAISKAPDHIPEVGNMVAQAISAEPAVATDEAEVVCAEAQQVDASPSAASIAWKALRDLTDPLGEAGTKIMGHARIYAQRQYEAGRASHGQAPAQTADFTTLGAAMRAIQQAIGLIGAPTDERMRAVRRVLRGAVVVAEDSGDIPAQPAPHADNVLYDPKSVLDVFNSARAGSEKPVGYLRGILAVIAHWESRPYPHHWMVPARADSEMEDAARLDWLDQNIFLREMDEWDKTHGGRGSDNMWVMFAPNGAQGSARKILDAARKQGASHDR